MARMGLAAGIGVAWFAMVATGWAQTSGVGVFLGVMVDDVASDQVRGLGLDRARGVVVTSVVPDSPAARAGFVEKDLVLAWDEENVRGVRQFIRLVQETPADRPVPVRVRRGRRETTLNVTLEARPGVTSAAPAAEGGDLPKGWREAVRAEVADLLARTPSPSAEAPPGRPADAEWVRTARAQFDEMMREVRETMAKLPPPPPPPRLGIATYTLTPDMAAMMGVAQGGGALVASVAAESPGQEAGIQPGDVLVAINGQPVRIAEDVARLVTEAGVNVVEIDLIRAGQPVQVEAIPIRPDPPRPRRTGT